MPNGNGKKARRASFNNPLAKQAAEIYLKQQAEEQSKQAEEQNNSQATANASNSTYGLGQKLKNKVIDINNQVYDAKVDFFNKMKRKQ